MPVEKVSVPGGTVVVAWRQPEEGGGIVATYAPDIHAWQAAATATLTAALSAAGWQNGDKLDRLLAKVEKLQASVTELKRQGAIIVADLTALKQEVADTTGAEQSAIVLIQGIEAQLANATSQADIDALTTALGTERAALAAAVAAPGAPPAASTGGAAASA